jgi:hypothetical protein
VIDYFQSLIANCASEWRAIPGYEGHYEVSEHGLVRSLTRRIAIAGIHKASHYRPKAGRFLSVKVNRGHGIGQGYYTYGVCLGGVQKNIAAHAAVAAAFIGKRPDGYDTDHIDGNTFNNHASNLRYCTKGVNAGKQNTKNRPFMGTSFMRNCNKYLAYIQIDGKRINLGSYGTREEALAVRVAKERELLGENAPIRGIL